MAEVSGLTAHGNQISLGKVLAVQMPNWSVKLKVVYRSLKRRFTGWIAC